MKLIIDIDENLCSYILKKDSVYFPDDGGELFEAVKNGTPLPKGHGDLIDRDVAREAMMFEMSGTGYQGRAMEVLDSDIYTPTIIEADKGE